MMNIQQFQDRILIELPSPDTLEKIQIRNKDIPNTKGVYFIFDERKNLIYIGQSTNLAQRMATQRTAIPNAAIISYILIEQWDEVDIVEGLYINIYKPIYNINPPWKTSSVEQTNSNLERIRYEDLRRTLDENKDRSLI